MEETSLYLGLFSRDSNTGSCVLFVSLAPQEFQARWQHVLHHEEFQSRYMSQAGMYELLVEAGTIYAVLILYRQLTDATCVTLR